MKNKTGQIVIIQEDFEIETALGGQKIQVKKGDKGFVDSRGMIHYMTGKARGKIQLVKDCEIKGYAYEDIAALILQRLNQVYSLKEMLEEFEIDMKCFKEEIEDVLSDIL